MKNNEYYKGDRYLVTQELTTDLHTDKYIFVGSGIDMFSPSIPAEWIERILEKCTKYDNTYLFQTKNPLRFSKFRDKLPLKTILGITLETNTFRAGLISKAPLPYARYLYFHEIPIKKMVSIEPVMDFDIETMILWIENINPEFVSIGADSKRHNLPEPSPEKLFVLITKLKKFTQVIEKNNLRRISNNV